MSKVCKQCGVKHKNSATKCGICGTPFEDVRVTVMKKSVIICSAIAVIVAVAIAIGLGFLIGPRAKVSHVMRCYKRGDTMAVVNSYASCLLDAEGYSREKIASIISKNVEDLSNYIVSFRTARPQDPNERDREALIDEMRYTCGDAFDESKLSDIKYVWVTFKGKESIYWGKTTTRFVVVKYDGRWQIWPDYVNF
ncbi:MAG: hypothetical protein J6L96_04170 [Clostridia bacterium]|nr:hypothetical protein [Oscillospiraceae bacterium]MBP3377922.1 hypothetical protein [Clostridia bacterium]